MRLLVFDGLKPGRFTWFETRIERDDEGAPKIDPETGGEIGGDQVFAHPGQRFPVDAIEPRFVEAAVATKIARVVEGELTAEERARLSSGERTSTSPPPPPAPAPIATEPPTTQSRLRRPATTETAGE